MSFKCNVGQADAIIRIILGLLVSSLITLRFLGPMSSWAYLALLGIPVMLTGIFGYCHAYTLIGIKTSCEKE